MKTNEERNALKEKALLAEEALENVSGGAEENPLLPYASVIASGLPCGIAGMNKEDEQILV